MAHGGRAGAVVGLHYHLHQADYWYVPFGRARVVLHDLRALGIRLVGEQTGQPIGPLLAFARDLAHIVDGIICYVGFLLPLWDAKRQTLADKLVKTVVVN